MRLWCQALLDFAHEKRARMFQIGILLLQICLQAAQVESRVGSHHIEHLVKSKPGKLFLVRSTKKKDAEEEAGQDYSNDDEVKVAKLLWSRMIDTKQD